MKTLDHVLKILLGAVFVFSGYVKAVDPLGMYYKIGDYLTAYNLSLLQPLAMVAAVAIIAVELLLGVWFVLQLFPRTAAWGMLVVEGFFTLLTLVSWQTNAVSDCGCFGDAIKLSNAATFWKNVLMMLPVLYLFWRRRHSTAWWPRRVQVALASLFLVAALGFQWYNYAHLPIHDFRPYYVGADLKKQMELPQGAKPAQYATTLYYEKNGKVQAFDENNYPWDDSTWVFRDSKTVLVEAGDVAPIHDFSILSPEGDDWLPMLLDDPGYKFLLVSYRLDKASVEAFRQLAPLYTWCTEQQIGFFPLTASGAEDIQRLNTAAASQYRFFATDQTTLKTIVRANPGLLLLRGSVVVGKWHYNDVPSLAYFQNSIAKP